MPNVSVPGLHGAWFSFANYGPVTTTYTPPTSCSATDQYRLGYVTQGLPIYDSLRVACSSAADWDCVPSGTASASITALANEAGEQFVGAGGYYSPGLYCPSGWATVGAMARDGSNSLSASGVLESVIVTTTITGMERPIIREPATLLTDLIKPSETVALCCPSAMTPDGMGGCYSVVSDYEPSVACSVSSRSILEYGTSTLFVTEDSTTRTTVGRVPTSTSYSVTTHSRTLGEKARSSRTGIAYAAMVTLLHHSSDFATGTASAGTASAGTASTGTTSSGTSTPTPTTNAAGRLNPRGSTWDGLGAVLSVSVAAIVLGAAIVLPL